MAVRHGYGKIAGTDALVFAYDTGDTRNSYKGEPTANLVTNPDFATGNYSGWSSTGVGGAVEITGVFSENGYNYFHKKVNKVTAGALDRITQSSVYTINTSLQTTVTFDIWINPLNAYYITFYGLGSTADDTTYDEKPLTSNGTTVKTVSLGEGWTRYIYTLSTAWYTGTGNTFRVAVYPDYGGTGLLEYKLRRVQVEQKSHATPFVNGTRSATQGLLNLAGPQTIDLTNASFDADAQIRFDGTSDYLNVGDNFGFDSPNFSFGALFYWDGDPKDGAIIAKRNDSPYNQYNLGISDDAQYGGEGSKIYVAIVPDGGGGATYGFFNYDLAPFGAGWYHALVTVDTTVQKLYVNGVNVGTNTKDYTGKTFRMTGNNLYVGAVNLNANPGKFFLGNIPIAHIYNRALTSDEVASTYRHYKSRFNI